MKGKKTLTGSENMVPPISLANISLQVVCRSSHDYVWRFHHGSNGQKSSEDSQDDTKSLDQIQIGDFHRFGWAYSKYHRYPIAQMSFDCYYRLFSGIIDPAQ